MPGGFPRDPEGRAGASRDLAVERHRPLYRHEREPTRQVLEVALVELPCLLLTLPDDSSDACALEVAASTASDPGARVDHREVDARNPGTHDGFAARRRPTVVAAGLQGGVQRGAGSR